MRHRVLVCATLMLIFMVAGCAVNQSQTGDAVLFDGPVHLFDEGVYWQGTKVGTVVNQETGSGNILRVTVDLSPELKNQMGNNMAIYVDNGRLSVARLQGIGEPLEAGTPLCGFTSKTDLHWFKFKTLLNDRITKATQRALSLQAQFG